jgi:hypothetical protein
LRDCSVGLNSRTKVLYDTAFTIDKELTEVPGDPERVKLTVGSEELVKTAGISSVDVDFGEQGEVSPHASHEVLDTQFVPRLLTEELVAREG